MTCASSVTNGTPIDIARATNSQSYAEHVDAADEVHHHRGVDLTFEVDQLGFGGPNQGFGLIQPDEPGAEIPGENVLELGTPELRDKPVVGLASQGDCVFRVSARKPVVGDDIRVDDDVHGLPLRLYSSTRP